MSTQTTTNVKFVVITDKGEWTDGATYDEAIAEFYDSLERWKGIFALNRKLGVADAEEKEMRMDMPTEIRGVVRRTYTTTYETTEEQLPYPPKDEQ